jgi:hypothetical protein
VEDGYAGTLVSEDAEDGVKHSVGTEAEDDEVVLGQALLLLALPRCGVW